MKKTIKLLAVLVTVVVLLACITVPLVINASENVIVNQEGVISALISFSDFNVVQGDTFKTTMSVSQASICSMALKLNYNKDVLKLISWDYNENTLVEPVVNTCLDSGSSAREGEIVIAFARDSNIKPEGILLDFTFEVNSYLTEGEYDFLQLSKEYNNSVSRMVDNTVQKINFSFDSPLFNIYKAGDIDLNGTVDQNDAVYILRYAAGLDISFSKYQLEIADAFSDGQVNEKDAVSVLRYAAEFNEIMGNRVGVCFYDKDGDLLAKKSVRVNDSLNEIPDLPIISDYTNGRWMTKNESGEYVDADFSSITQNTEFYAVYDKELITDAMRYYINRLISDHPAANTFINGDITLCTGYVEGFASGYKAEIVWESTNSSILNDRGEYSIPAYYSEFSMVAKIRVMKDGTEESRYELEIPYKTEGEFKTPTKSEIEAYLRAYIGTTISTDLKLPKKVTNDEINSTNAFEVRVEWSSNSNYLSDEDQIVRGTTSSVVDLVATVTFNGKPLENDGKMYFDDITLTPVSEEEIKAYIISQIAQEPLTVSDGYTLWNNDTKYGASVTWISGSLSTATIANNVITINQSAVNGASLPLTARVTYATESGSKEFSLNYIVSVATNNDILVAGVNIDENLYVALKNEFDVRGNLTTGHLKDELTLDLSEYPEIVSLNGLQYCENLHWLNISGLKIESLYELCTLRNLEVLFAQNCGLINLSYEGKAVLDNMKNLKVLDLSENNLENLNGVLSNENTYPRLIEIYLNDNKLSDISLVKNATFLQSITLSNNSLKSEAIGVLSQCDYLKYLSLANNNIDDISALSNLASLTELRLQNNNIDSVSPLKKLTALQALYLGNNELESVDNLYNLEQLRILYINDNDIKDIEKLEKLSKLNVLNISNNKIDDISVLQLAISSVPDTTVDDKLYSYNGIITLSELNKYDEFEGLIELYAENNEIRKFSVVKNFTTLKKLCLANNNYVQERDISTDLSNLTNLVTLTLSNKPIEDLSFLNNMTKLSCLEIVHCNIPSYIADVQVQENSDGEKTEVATLKVDNVNCIAQLKDSLKYLDISDNPFTTDEALCFIGNTPVTLAALGELNLNVLYADNVNLGTYVSVILEGMPRLTHLSLENAGIVGDTDWLDNSRNFIFIDLADNAITNVNMTALEECKTKLKTLYLDTTAEECTATNAFEALKGNVLENVSLRNVKVYEIKYLPDMDYIKYFDLHNTGIKDFVNESEIYSISRYSSLEYLDVSQSDVNIFTKANLDMLYENFADIYVKLYADSGIYAVPEGFEDGGKLNADRESAKLLELYLMGEEELYDITSADVNDPRIKHLQGVYATIEAAETVGEDGTKELVLYNKQLPTTVGGYEVEWTVDKDSYVIENGYLKIVDSTGVEINQELTLTAKVASIVGTEPGSMSTFKVIVKYLKLGDEFIEAEKETPTAYNRGASFKYHIYVKTLSIDGFTEAVAPKDCSIEYSYSVTDENGESLNFENVLEFKTPEDEKTHRYTIRYDAPLGSKVTISVKITDENGNVKTRTYSFTVGSRTVKIDFVMNGGESIKSVSHAEDTKFAIEPKKEGHKFLGWYTDSDCTKLAECYDENNSTINKDSAETWIIVPRTDEESVKLYAKWKKNTYKLTVNEGEGTWVGVYEGSSTSGKLLLDYSGSIDLDYGTQLYIDRGLQDGYENFYCNIYPGTMKFTQDFTINTSATKKSSCLVKGSLIMLPDGSFEKIENLNYGDSVLTFDHATGEYIESKIAFTFYANTETRVIELIFSDGTVLKLANTGHGLFDNTLNEYVLVGPDNVSEYVGHKFNYVSYKDGKAVQTEIELVSYNVTTELVERYDIATANQLNHIAGGLLACSDVLVGFCNVFDFADGGTYDVEQMNADIQKYGLYCYDEWREYVAYEEFATFNGGYFKIAIEKGLMTEADLLSLINDLRTMWE